MSTKMMKQNQIGPIRILTNKFVEMRSKHLEEIKRNDKLTDMSSSLNDNGKTR